VEIDVIIEIKNASHTLNCGLSTYDRRAVQALQPWAVDAGEVTVSNDAIRKFLEKADGETELQDRLEAALAEDKNGVASFLEVAAESGFEFTADEFLEAMEDMGMGKDGAELDDEQLEAVAGGLSFGTARMRTIASRAGHLFAGFRAGPGIRGFGGGKFAEELEEEELVQG
jgi:predicted ribosomally synthesized peptide with nif11-like leader